MLFSKIWERYFAKEFLKTVFAFLFCFYGLYVLIDYSNHSATFHHQQIKFQFEQVVYYYLWDFVRRLDVLLPFAILIGTIRTLCTLNVHNELIALLSGGVSLHTLMRPLVFFGLIFTGLMYVNNEFVLPMALKDLKQIEDFRRSQKSKYNEISAVQSLILEDNSTIIFQNFDSLSNRFFDAYWIRSVDDIYRIKYLYPSPHPEGLFVDHLKRNKKGELVVIETIEKKALPEILFNKKTLFDTITSPEEQSVSELLEKLPQSQTIRSEKESQIIAIFYQKLVLPWLCLLAVIGPAPLCMRFTRHFPVFFVYATCIFSLVAVYLSIDAMALLAKRQVFDPFWAIWGPFSLFFAFFVWRFVRLR